MYKVLRIIMYITIFLLFGINILFVISTKKEIFGLNTIKVDSKTMSPTIEEGNLVIYKRFNIYYPNEIIVTENLDNLYVNRIYKIDNRLVTTMNDAKTEVYQQKNIEDIKGKVIFIVNKYTLILYIICILLLVAFIAYDLSLIFNPEKKF